MRTVRRWREPSRALCSIFRKSKPRPLRNAYLAVQRIVAASISARYKTAILRKFSLALLALVGTVGCWRSLQGPRHRPSGTRLSSGTMPATFMATPTTRAPDHLDGHLARGAQTRAQDCEQNSSFYGQSQKMPRRRHTQDHALCVPKEFHGLNMSRTRGVLRAVHHLTRGRCATAMLCRAGRTRRARARRAR